MYYLYILKCADQSLYTGICVDLDKRFEEHNSTALGAKYTRGRRPVELVFSQRFRTRATAAAKEYRIKQLSRDKKLKLITKGKV
ncbi:MAG: Excinuclease ABC C subunit domain protein [Parcubacteria group bacterium GW2011_GWA2_47_8]|nr:MAG: Excinuclease ABC C subunit domain protein [Parcubacteria group bacterium GW2011_GWA2_47_8]OHB18726.1 MAG: endonuclease [Parcubacteria group bacterium RIFCSPHIGHO2_01_FULL_47_10b]